MLTILMETRDNEAELAQTLSALVSAAVEGLVSDVIVLDHGSTDGSSRVADAAGCRFVTRWDVREILSSARGQWLLLLEPGARPSGRWIDEVAEYMSHGRAPARFRPSRYHRRSLFRRLFQKSTPLERGLLLSRQQALASARKGMHLSDFTGVRPVQRLSSELVPAWVVAAGHRPAV